MDRHEPPIVHRTGEQPIHIDVHARYNRRSIATDCLPTHTCLKVANRARYVIREIPKEPRNDDTGERGSGNGPLEGKRVYQWLTINTSRTNHSIFSDDFPAARPANKKTRCITRGTRT